MSICLLRSVYAPRAGRVDFPVCGLMWIKEGEGKGRGRDCGDGDRHVDGGELNGIAG